MNHKLKGCKVIHGDITIPEITIFEFNKDFNANARKKMLAALNHGDEMIEQYALYRSDLTMPNVVRLLESLEGIYQDWRNDVYED